VVSLNIRRTAAGLSSPVPWLSGSLRHLRCVVSKRRAWIGVLISIVCLFLALRRVAWQGVLSGLRMADYRLIALAMAMQAGAVSATALRWKTLFYPYPRLPASKFVSVAFIGELANTILPARLGYLVRVFLIGELEGISRTFALGTIVVEKILDGLMLLLVFGLLIPFMPFPRWLWQAGFFILAAIVVLLVSAIGMSYRKDRIFTLASRLSRRFPTLDRLNLPDGFGLILDGLDSLRPTKVGWEPWAWSVLISVLGILVNFTALIALGIHAPLIVPCLLLVVLQIGAKVPSLSASIGVFEYLCLLSLSLFSVDGGLALGFGFLLHLIVLLPPTLLGVLCLWRENLGLQALGDHDCPFRTRTDGDTVTRRHGDAETISSFPHLRVSASPHLPLEGESVICISDRDWDFLWMRPQEITTRFARGGNRVLFIEALGLRTPGLRDFTRIVGRVRNWLKQRLKGVRQVEENLYVYTPIIVPFLDLRGVDSINRIILVSSVERLMKRLGFSRPIIWTYYPTQTALNLIDSLDHKLLIYDYMDAWEYNPGGVVRGFARGEEQCLRKADLVFTTSESLYARASRCNRNTYRIAAAVNLNHFRQPNGEGDVLPPDLVEIASPRIGYFGQIDRRLDVDLLQHLARSHPEWSLVMIGAVRTDISTLKRLKNVYFLNMKSHRDLPQYLVNLDVLTIPYLINNFTNPIYPAKIYECFAVGKPVVATNLPELRPLEGLIRIARGKADFVQHVSQALLSKDEDLSQRQWEVARRNSWKARYDLITEKIIERCQEKGEDSRMIFSAQREGF
jgi:uncharacterized membrane protein YbhN (UPF0104 family)/glycosyltransferase involved in cell wall biosynthesis